MPKNFLNKNLNLGKSKIEIDFDVIRDGIIQQDRKTLAKTLTLVENSNHSFDPKLLAFLASLPSPKHTIRVSFSGPPGVGKSTLIEELGLLCIAEGKKIAVLAIDPSSESGKGSVLGDKTRMVKLANNDNAFIRPSPNNLELGGIRKSTYDSIRVCEAAGFDYIFIETVGVGQSEIDAWNISDIFTLIVSPTGGDDLQGIKRGIMEKADVIVINKSDGKLVSASESMYNQLKSTNKIMRPTKLGSETKIFKASALYNTGISNIYEHIKEVKENLESSDSKFLNRQEKEINWFINQLGNMIYQLMNHHPQISKSLRDLMGNVNTKKLDFYEALNALNSIISSLKLK